MLLRAINGAICVGVKNKENNVTELMIKLRTNAIYNQRDKEQQLLSFF